MPESIEIREIRLSEMTSDQMTSAMAQSGVSWYNLTLTVQNLSNVTPIYVIVDIRRIQYDASRRALLVQLSEHKLPVTHSDVGLPLPPRYGLIEPLGQITLSHPLSSPITFLEESSEGAMQPYYVRIAEDVDRIECTLAYNTDAPAPVVNLTARESPKRGRRKDAIVQASWSPSRKDNTDSSAEAA